MIPPLDYRSRCGPFTRHPHLQMGEAMTEFRRAERKRRREEQKEKRDDSPGSDKANNTDNGQGTP
jgi:hypothetical protein